MAAPFALFFTGRSVAIPGTSLTQADATHWVSSGCVLRSCGSRIRPACGSARLGRSGSVNLSIHSGCCSRHQYQAGGSTCFSARAQVLDTTSTVAPDYHQLQEVAIFLTQPNPLPPDMGLGAKASCNTWQPVALRACCRQLTAWH